MTITIVGATGFLGQNLIRYLLEHTDYRIRAFSRSASNLSFEDKRVEKIPGSIFEPKDLEWALEGADAAVYLFHMMGSTEEDFYDGEARAAAAFVAAVKTKNLQRTVFMGGLGDDNDPHLSKHLASRHHSGEILRQGLPGVIELRASMIIGKGSVGYDIITTITDTLPMVFIPRWAVTPTQPIMLQDALAYTTAALTLPGHESRVIEIGGPEQLTYRDLATRCARERGKRAATLTVPFVPRKAAIWWLSRYTKQKSAAIGEAMVDSLVNPMVVNEKAAERLFPAIRPLKVSFKV